VIWYKSIVRGVKHVPRRKENQLVHVSHLEQYIFAHTKSLGTHQVQASWLINHPIVFQIIEPIIVNDWYNQGHGHAL
jgi:hypothetical protein